MSSTTTTSAMRMAAAIAVVLVCATCLQSTVIKAEDEVLATAPAPAPLVGNASGLSIPPFAGIMLMGFLSFWVSSMVNVLFGHSN